MYNNSNTTSAPKLFTGLAAFSVLGVNPSKEQIEKFIGREYKLNVNYDIVELNGKSVRPIEIWIKEASEHMDPVPIRFYISTVDDIAGTGAIRFVNDKGSFTYSKSAEVLNENEKMKWFTSSPFRPAKVGECELFTFMQRLMRYNSIPADANFMAENVKNEITIEHLFNNNLSGLRKFFDWCNENNNKIVLIAAIRSTSKIVDGEEKLYYNQTVCNNSNFYFQTSTSEVSSRSISIVNDALAKGDRITKYLFTVEFQPFVKNECVNNVPQEVASSQQPYDPSKLI